MDELVLGKQLERKIQRYYPKDDQAVTLRVHCMQLFCNLSDPAMEDSLYQIESMRGFTGLSLTGAIPDETTIVKFRHLLERHNLGETLLKEVSRHLDNQGLSLKEGSIVDARLIEAPTSKKI